MANFIIYLKIRDFYAQRYLKIIALDPLTSGCIKNNQIYSYSTQLFPHYDTTIKINEITAHLLCYGEPIGSPWIFFTINDSIMLYLFEKNTA